MPEGNVQADKNGKVMSVSAQRTQLDDGEVAGRAQCLDGFRRHPPVFSDLGAPSAEHAARTENSLA
jgi:hypothetical protein